MTTKQLAKDFLAGYDGVDNLTDGRNVVIDKKGGGFQVEVWIENGYLHRIDGPALRYIEPFRLNGEETWIEEWYLGGELHRTDGPALIETRTKEGGLAYRSEEWHRHGYLHRVDGPARTTNHKNGDFIQGYYVNGISHRVDGPAYISRRGAELTINYEAMGRRYSIAGGPSHISFDGDCEKEYSAEITDEHLIREHGSLQAAHQYFIDASNQFRGITR